MNTLIKCISIGLFCVCSLFSKANETDGRYLTSRDGLSNSSVNCLLQDSCGLLWIGSWDGLNRYDSRDIRVYKPDLISSATSISNNIIRHLVEERRGVIWISTDYGINRYDLRSDRFRNYFSTDIRKNVFKERTFLLAKNKAGCIFAFVNKYGLYCYDPGREDFVKLDLQISFNVKQMFFDGDDRLWLCTEENELFRMKLFRHPTGKFEIESLLPIPDIGRVESVFYDPVRDVIWAQNGKMLYRIDPADRSFCPVAPGFAEKITAMLFLPDGCYVGTLKGLYRWSPERQIAEPLLNDIPVNFLYPGEQHIVWVGTDTRGVFMLSDRQERFLRSSRNEAVDFGNAPVRAFWETPDGTLFIGTKGKGLFILSPDAQRVVNLTIKDGLLHNSVYAFSGDDEYVWICTEGQGLNYYSLKQKKLLEVKGAVPDDLKCQFSIYSRNDTTLWIGTNGWGIFKLIIDRSDYPVSIRSFTRYRYRSDRTDCLNNNSVFSILPDGERGLWIGTRGGGLNRLDFAGGKFRHYRHAVGKEGTISNDDVLCLYSDPDGSLWVGTSNGLNRLVDPEEGRFRWYTEKEGMPNNTVHGILRDRSDHIWVSTNRGLARVDKNRGKIVSYFSADGLQDDEFSDGAFYRSPGSDKFYFGGMNGYTSFDPMEIKADAYEPKLYLSAFFINNDPAQLHDRLDKKGVLRLNYRENLLTFQFVPVDYIQGTKCELAYRLKGYNDHWAHLGTSGTIVLNNLSPGSYTLYVRCCNADKEWCDNVFMLMIRIRPPWWLSGYAYLGYTVFLALCTGFLYRNSIHKLKMKRKLEREMLENQKAEEIHQAKLRFFTNIAHEFCNSLTLIYGPSERLFKLCGDNPVLKRYLTVIKSNAERMQALIQQLIEFRKAETGYLDLCIRPTDIGELVVRTADYFTDRAEEKEIFFIREAASGSIVWNTDRSAFEKILFNLLSNAFKYTPEKGEVSLSLASSGGWLQVIVRNTGPGIGKEEQASVFNRFEVLDRLEDQILNGTETRTGIGLALCKSLVDLLKGSIRIDSRVNEYTAFILEFPPLEADRRPEPGSASPNVPGTGVTPLKRPGQTNERTASGKADLKDHLDTLLVVDDDAEIRSLLVDVLQDRYNVLTASDGANALYMLEKRIPDLIICDVIMPGINGFELIGRIKSQELTARIPIIFLSSDASVDSRIESVHRGAEVYLTKPFHEEHLLATVEQLLNNRRDLKDYFNSPASAVEYVDGKLVHKEEKEFIYRLTKIMSAHLDDEKFTLDRLALEMGISKIQLYRKLKEIKNETPTDFIRNLRLKHAEHLLKTTNETVLEIMYRCGFNNKAYFYRVFQKTYQMTPKEFRDNRK